MGHLSKKLLQAYLRGDLEFSDLAPHITSHLLEICPECNAAFEAVEEEARQILAANNLSRSVERACRTAAEMLPQAVESSRDRAEALAEELRGAPADTWRARVLRNRGDVEPPLLAELLIEESRSRLPGKPLEAVEFARLAKEVLAGENLDALAVEQFIRAVAHLGNALFRSGDLAQASDCYQHARYLLRMSGGGDRLQRAEIDRLEAALRRGQRRLDEALELFGRAITLYRAEDCPNELTRTLLGMGMAYRETGEIAAAVGVTEEAAILADRLGGSRLRLIAQHNLADLSVDAGDYAHAREILAENLGLYRQFSDSTSQLQLLWVEGRLARGEGDAAAAESSLLAVRDGFLRHDSPFDAALASLELATLYAEQGRATELKPLAAELVPAFQALEIHREALAAWMLFVEAAEAEQANVRLIRQLHGFLEGARMNPGLRFRDR